MTRFVFVTGGVISSLGKGLAAASIAMLLQSRGYRVRLRKLDPYLNVDPGTMSPTQHGEVFVTADGAETDLDLGHYERFTGVDASRRDSVSTGQIYQNVIARERRGDYLGATVQVIPHVTDALKAAIVRDMEDVDFALIEIGGTVGDIESLPFLDAIRQLGNDLGVDRVMYVHLTLVPYIAAAGELKTKPTQHSVKELQNVGIRPNMLLCRSDREIPEAERRKIAQFCNVRPDAVVSAVDVRSIYEVPLRFAERGLDLQVLRHFGMAEPESCGLVAWRRMVESMSVVDAGRVSIAIVGKYVSLRDAYKSLCEALSHAGVSNRAVVELSWVDCEDVERLGAPASLASCHAILVPGGFGERGTEGKIAAIRYARERGVPFLGICFGMQMAVIEMARSLGGVPDASSSEFGPGGTPVVGLMTEWATGEELHRRAAGGDLGGTMRLGAFEAVLSAGSVVSAAYGGAGSVVERHRHRYEVDLRVARRLEDHGLRVVGLSPDGILPEAVEIPSHPFFVGVQYHPELISRPLAPHPLFVSFVAAAVRQSSLV